MTTPNKVLLGALGIQAVLALITNWPSSGTGEPRDLLGFSIDDVQTIEITGRKARDEIPLDPLKLTRGESGWVITSADDYPVKDDLLQPVLDSLAKLKVKGAIASSDVSATNLEVAEDAFTRLLVVTAKDGTSRKVYVGAGQGKTSHVRLDGEKDIYDVEISAWGLAETSNRYFDRDFLKVDLSTVTTVTIQRPAQPPIAFGKGLDGAWTLAGRVEPLDQGQTGTFLNGLLNVRMMEPVGRTAKPEMGLDGPGATVVTWTAVPQESDAGGPSGPTTGSYRVGAEVPGKTGRFYLKADASPWVVEVIKGNVANALDKPLDKLYAGAVDLNALGKAKADGKAPGGKAPGGKAPGGKAPGGAPAPPGGHGGGH